MRATYCQILLKFSELKHIFGHSNKKAIVRMLYNVYRSKFFMYLPHMGTADLGFSFCVYSPTSLVFDQISLGLFIVEEEWIVKST